MTPDAVSLGVETARENMEKVVSLVNALPYLASLIVTGGADAQAKVEAPEVHLARFAKLLEYRNAAYSVPSGVDSVAPEDFGGIMLAGMSFVQVKL